MTDYNHSPLDINKIYLHIYKKCHDSSIAWQAVSEAWLHLDQTQDAGRQIEYMKRAAYGYMLDEFKHRRKYIPDSALSDTETEGAESFITTKLSIDINQAGDIDLQTRALKLCPDYARAGLILTLHAIFDGKFHSQINTERIRKLLQLHDIEGELSQMSRTILKVLTTAFIPLTAEYTCGRCGNPALVLKRGLCQSCIDYKVYYKQWEK